MIASSPSEVEVSGCRLSMHMNVTLYQYHNIFTKETISAFLCFPPPGIINPTIMIHGRRTLLVHDLLVVVVDLVDVVGRRGHRGHLGVARAQRVPRC